MSLFCEAQPFQNSDDPDVHPVFRGRRHIHLMADSEQELIQYAKSIGLREYWVQRTSNRGSNFDVTGVFMIKVLNDPRVEKLPRDQFVARYKSLWTRHA